MTNIDIYEDIAKRTKGEIYLGVVGPVRTGKSTFIRKFSENVMLPNIVDEYTKERAKDEMPQSGTGKTVMTTEPKFVPGEAVEVTFNNNIKAKLRLIDCVGYM
ncbi:MAG TPA: stage IV sporulation protein A, partial [Tissierellia bacterium]|nr:stage IV sporulation protein A [Tissierellia bacterium]